MVFLSSHYDQSWEALVGNDFTCPVPVPVAIAMQQIRELVHNLFRMSSAIASLDTAPQTLPETMTAVTPIRSALSATSSSKCVPKRAVSFAKVCNYRRPGNLKMTCPSDEVLQSTDHRRRYQRRGSKAPSMLLLSVNDLANIQEVQPCPEKATCTTTSDKRRMSLMTALKQNLERSCILEPVAAKTMRRLSMDANRSYALELL